MLTLNEIEAKLAAMTSHLTSDQGGSLELGSTISGAAGVTPYIDFHFGSLAQDYNTRIINDDNATLSIHANILVIRGARAGTSSQVRVHGNLAVAGKIQMKGKPLDQWMADLVAPLFH